MLVLVLCCWQALRRPYANDSQQIGFEIWTMQNDILFDNIYIGHSVEEAEQLRKETFDVKFPIEEAEEEASKPKPEDAAPEGPTVSFKEDPVTFVRQKVDHFIGLAKEDPINAAKTVPEVAGGLAALLFTSILIIFGAIGSSTPAPAPKKGKAPAAGGKEKKNEATSSSADTGKGGATKRTTRSSAE